MVETKRKLDKSRPFGIVVGDPARAFEQDGVHYNAEGVVVDQWTTPEALQNERALAEQRKHREQQAARVREEAQRHA
jgi:hypothetical protein